MTRRRRGLVMAAIVVVAIAALELLAPLVYRTTHGVPFPAEALRRRLRHPTTLGQMEAPGADRMPTTVSGKDLHPYFGFAYRHGLGFTSDQPLLRRTPGAVNVAITGGSFAEGVFLHAGERLQQKLAADVAAYRGREVRLVALTMGGFKQPQQVMALAWCQVLGAQYDLVVNIDGFNEVALPWAENLPHRVAAAYPRSWQMYALKGFEPAATLALARVFELERRRERLRRVFATPPLAWSRYALQLWAALDDTALDDVREAYIRWIETASGGGDSERRFGPYHDYPDEEAAFRAMATEWAESSRQLAHLAEGAGARYLHVLQPNQYVPGSKPMSAAERRVAILDQPYAYRDAVLAGYPLLAAAGDRLAAEGEAFLDLRFLFEHEPRPVWADSCCHLNDLGYEQVADAIVAALAADEHRRQGSPAGG